jgi:hypothetical protein
MPIPQQKVSQQGQGKAEHGESECPGARAAGDGERGPAHWSAAHVRGRGFGCGERDLGCDEAVRLRLHRGDDQPIASLGNDELQAVIRLGRAVVFGKLLAQRADGDTHDGVFRAIE